MEQYCLYLRKSRSDQEAESRGETETLARHEKTLIELAKRLHLDVTSIYREVVSGETIATRPVIQQILKEVESGMWSGVLVMEVERLARGDTIDQGIMAQTFKYSDTKIITPMKIYDPNNEFDEEYFEFGLFMSRREYKTINRRMQRGRAASSRDGKYTGNIAPYGYKRVKLLHDKGWTLEPIEEQARVVQLIFNAYVGIDENAIGPTKIAHKLSSIGIKPLNSEKWSVATIRDILSNPVYIGKIRSARRPQVKKSIDGTITKSRPRNDKCSIYDGLHAAIIEEALYQQVQEKLKNIPASSINVNTTMQNPLAGLVVCAKCGRKLIRKPYKNDSTPGLLCVNPYCNNVSSNLNVVEKKVIESLAAWAERYKLANPSKKADNKFATMQETQMIELTKELQISHQQLDKLHDLLEQGIYTSAMFLDRTKKIAEKIEATKKMMNSLQTDIAYEKALQYQQEQIIPKIENLIHLYWSVESPESKNNLLKEVLEKAVYLKEKRCGKCGNLDNFSLQVFPRLTKTAA